MTRPLTPAEQARLKKLPKAISGTAVEADDHQEIITSHNQNWITLYAIDKDGMDCRTWEFSLTTGRILLTAKEAH